MQVFCYFENSFLVSYIVLASVKATLTTFQERSKERT